MAKILLFLFLFSSTNIFAQQFLIKGIITNTKLEPLAYATIQVKESPINTLSKQDGSYQILLENGKYEIVVSLIGYKTQVFTIIIKGKDENLQVILEENLQQSDAATVIGQKKDKSEELIRNVIKNKENILHAINNYSAAIYIRATEENSKVKKTKTNSTSKNSKVKIDSANLDLVNMSMAEIQMQLDFQYPNQTKETRNGVKKRGNPESLFYLSTTEGDFSLYNNLMHIRGIAVNPFLSPISYSGLIAYKYKTIRTRKVNNHNIYTISFKPSALGNALLTGEVEIMDSAWVILNSNFSLPKNHLAEYNQFTVEQEYKFVNDSAWLLSKQKFSYFAKEGKSNMNGVTNVYYNDYIFNKIFPKKHFGVELSSTSKEAYERDTTYWQTIRTEPLNDKELRFIRYKDSVYRATNTKQYLDSIDAITNKITAKKVLLDGITFYNRAKQRNIFIGSLSQLYEPLSPGGTRIGYNAFYSKTFKNKKNISMHGDLSYGLRNKDINGNYSFSRMYNPFNRGYYFGSIGRSFDQLFENDISIYTIQKRNIFRKYHFSLGHGVELLNGLFLTNELELATRESLSGFKFFDWKSILSDTATYNWLTNYNTPRDFVKHNAFYNNIKLSYTPFQQYMREPLEKVILGSKWPTLSASWRKGIPKLFGSNTNYDYVELNLSQTVQLGTTGISKYNVIVGKFLNRKSIEIADRKFMRGADPYVFLLPERNFQHLDSTFELTKTFYEGHYIHDFNGALLSKIPLLKKLNLRELAGGGFLFAPERNLRYFELFAGIESMPFRIVNERFKLGLFVVGSVANQFKNPIGLKISIRQWDKRNNRWL